MLRCRIEEKTFQIKKDAVIAAANIRLGGGTLLSEFCAILDPFARIFGLDGAILAAFILGFPANEIVLPILLMIYTGGGDLYRRDDLHALSLALLHHLLDDKKGSGRREMDAARDRAADGRGADDTGGGEACLLCNRIDWLNLF